MLCDKCGWPIPRRKQKTQYELKQELGDLLNLKPKGRNADGEKYYGISSRSELQEMILAVKKIMDKKP